MTTSYEIFTAVTPGLEGALTDELKEIVPGTKCHVKRGGVELRGTREVLWSLSARSRLAETVRVRIGRFKAKTFAELENGLNRIPWSAYLARNAPVAVQATARKSALYHSGAIIERVVKALDRPVTPPGGAGVRVWVRLVKDHATVSVDAGGGLLHRRGWRQAVGRAPLRETLAAACVRLAGIGPDQAVWDPFCGAGTVPIEAALQATGHHAQNDRDFAFQDWPTFDSEAFQAWRGGLPAPSETSRVFIGTDCLSEAVRAASENCVRAGVTANCTWLEGDFEAHLDVVPSGAAIVTNTPYGKRLRGGDQLTRLFERFGEVLRRRPDIGPVLAMVGARGFEKATGLAWQSVADISNRGTPARLVRFTR